jgi:hypothetical protein
MDKTRGLLWGGVAADNKSLRIIQNARLPSGKKVLLQEPPISDFAALEYEDPKEFTTDLRKVRFLPVLTTACLRARAEPCSWWRTPFLVAVAVAVAVVLSCFVCFSPP